MNPDQETIDDAIAGGGILGLAHAYHLARRGRRVVVFERDARAQGASIRNFGMLWPIGQPAGPMYDLAMRSRAHWLEVLEAAGLWHDRCGSLHLAYREDEAAVLREFARAATLQGHPCELLEAREVARLSPFVREEGLILGLFSPTETCVDPRQAVSGVTDFLAREHGVSFRFGVTVFGFDPDGSRVETSVGPFEVERLWVCGGDDLRTLYPEALGSSGLVRCKLQMLRSEPLAEGQRLGPMLAGGLTLRHYQSFAECPSLAALRERVSCETPRFDRYGIHVMASQNGQGELVLGDSHEYGDAIEPFDKEEIDRLILDYLDGFLQVPALAIASRWHGTYAKHPTEPYLVLEPAPGAAAITGLGGAGMTLSFGLAERVVRDVLKLETAR